MGSRGGRVFVCSSLLPCTPLVVVVAIIVVVVVIVVAVLEKLCAKNRPSKTIHLSSLHQQWRNIGERGRSMVTRSKWLDIRWIYELNRSVNVAAPICGHQHFLK